MQLVDELRALIILLENDVEDPLSVFELKLEVLLGARVIRLGKLLLGHLNADLV